MASMPEFIQAYHDEIPDEKVAKELRILAIEYNQKVDTLNKNKTLQQAHAKMHEDFGGKSKKLDFGRDETALTNEYKVRAMQLSQPHIEDPEKFKEIVNEHGPDPEYLKAIEERKEEKERANSFEPFTQSQEKMDELKGKHLAPTFDELATNDGPELHNNDAVQEQSQKNSERAQKLEELKNQFAQNRERIHGKEL